MKTKYFSRYYDNRISYNHLCYQKPDWNEIIPQNHDVFEVIFVTKGSLIYTTSKKTYTVYENSIILTRPGDYHMLALNNCDIYERYDIIFDEKIVAKSALDRLPGELDIIIPKNPEFFSALFKKFDFYCEAFSGEELSRMISNVVEEIFYNICYISGKSQDDLYNTASFASPILGEVTEYIEKNVSSNFSVESLCSKFYISKSYLLKLFNKHMQMPPQKYILSRRMVRAQNLLRSGKKPTDIFSDCGFLDYSTFYRNYKSFFGHSPSEEMHIQKIRRIEY